MSEEVQRYRRQEEAFYLNTNPPRLAKEVIRKLQLHLDDDGDLVFLFENAERRYALCVVLASSTTLGWKECQAINDVMKLASRGTQIDNEAFVQLVSQLKNKYGKVQDANLQNGRLTAVVCPGKGTIRPGREHTIVNSSIKFDRDGDLVISAATNKNMVYRVCLELHLPDKCMQDQDCKAFVDILTMLETGDRLSPQQYFAGGAVLRQAYNWVTPNVSSDGQLLCISVMASRVPSNKPMPSLFSDALRNTAAQTTQSAVVAAAAAARATGNGHAYSGPPCPYPGIMYIKAIKEGGQGQVFAGKRLTSEERVAIKVFLDQEGAAEAYKTELRMLLKMSRHANVVQVLDFFETPAPALVMRLIDGEDLMDYLRSHGACPEESGRRLAIGIAEGLCHLHRHGVIHRDFKSANIIRRVDGTPVIIDLGLGSVLDRKAKKKAGMTVNEMVSTMAATHVSERTSTIRGSFPWMAPEMITDHEWSDKIDVYAFGIIMWEIFSGQTPFVQSGEEVLPVALLIRIVKGERPPMSIVSHLSSDLQSLIQACWDATPQNRPSMRRVLDLLHRNDPRRIFKSVDRNESGGLDFGEFVMFLQQYARGRVQNEQMPGLFNAIDEDESGEIGIEEFERFWREVEASGLKNVVRNARQKKVG